jgi:hypothetical protein
MRHRVILGVAVFAAAAGSLVLGAAPASAVGPPPAVCASDSSCLVELNYNVTYAGSTGGDNGVVFPPPPCIGVPFGDAYDGSQKILSEYGDTSPVASPTPTPTPSASASASPAPSGSASASGGPSPSPTALFTSPAADPATSSPPAAPALTAAEQQVVNRAKSLESTNPEPSGEWYQIDQDPAATQAASQKCLTLPAYLWVPGGSNLLRVDGLNVPVETLADLAFNQLNTAQLGHVTLDPTGASDTNLPTFVDAQLQSPVRGILSVTPGGDPFVYATAETPDGEAATVYARMTSLTINPGTANATVWDQSRCSVVHPGDNGPTSYALGSRYSTAAMAQVGAGQAIDCGVTYTSPGTYGLTVSISWKACWAPGQYTGNGLPAVCRAVPGAQELAPTTSAPDQVTVREIQSVNNG